MPIGKNSIKRVANNGYANLTSTAPDMENSVIAPVEKKAEECAPAAEGKSEKLKKAPAKKKASAPKKKSDENVAKPKAEEASPEAERGEYVSFGEDMPVYLL